MLLIAALSAAAAATAPEPKAVTRATVRIERAVRVTGKAWEHLPPSSRSERRIVDEHGRELLLRVVELP